MQTLIGLHKTVNTGSYQRDAPLIAPKTQKVHIK